MFFIHTETKNEKKFTPDKIIYLLGFCPQSLYLFFHLQNNGFSPIILETPQKISEVEKDEFIIKEDRLLQRCKFKIKLAHKMEYPCQILIIPQSTTPIRNGLCLLSPSKLKNIPVVYLGLFEKTSFLTDVLETPVIFGSLTGFPELEKKQLSVFGRNSTLTLSCESTNSAAYILKDALKNSTIDITLETDQEQNFWNSFIPYAAGSLLSAATGENIFTMTKSPEQRQLISECLMELSQIAITNGTKIDTDNMLRKIYNIPSSYTFPLQKNFKNGSSHEFNKLSGVLTHKTKINTVKTPILRKLFKQIYDKNAGIN